MEVLKGPQGTLFGRNASGGLIQIITADPSDDPELALKAGYANYDTVTLSGYGNLPLTDTLAANLSASYWNQRSEEHTSELQSLMRISYAVFCLKKKKQHITQNPTNNKENTRM